jgi:hypothetical protein
MEGNEDKKGRKKYFCIDAGNFRDSVARKPSERARGGERENGITEDMQTVAARQLVERAA